MEPVRLLLSLADRTALHNHYMPMIRGGGIFIPCEQDLDFGDKVVLEVNLLSEKQKAKVPGCVVWITPPNTARGAARGVGIQILGVHQPRIQQYFEGLLGERLVQPPPKPAY
ncbi:MAG: pilus assembly protein PilZ [Proteobacteria bacterium]|nr:MAG: pilus assembly protein PilZ [Pseudomonadota bacterium]